MAAPPARARADYDYLIKLLLIGDSGVGKSFLRLRFSDGSFTTSFITTIGINLRSEPLSLMVRGSNYKSGIRLVKSDFELLQQLTIVKQWAFCWFMMLPISHLSTPTFLNSVFDVQNWIHSIEQHASDNVNKILVGNKADMDESKRAVLTSQGQALADEYGIKFFETSAKTNLNVEEVFFSIARDIKQRLSESDNKAEPTTLKINLQDAATSGGQAAQKSSCCRS